MENNKTDRSGTGHRGVMIDKRRPGKFVASYFNKHLQRTIYIGSFDTIDEAVVERANYIRDVYDGLIDESLYRTKGFPKGVSKKSNKYQSIVTYSSGKNKDKYISHYIGVFDTIDEAVKAREDFIKSLF